MSTSPVKHLTDSILVEAGEEASRIERQAEAEVRAILDKARAQAEARRREILLAAERQGGEEARRAAIRTELLIRRRLLQQKNRYLDEAFRQAQALLGRLERSAWEEWMLREMLASVTNGREEVQTAPGDREAFAVIVDRANQELGRRGLPGELRLADRPAEIDGGFILLGPDFLVDRSYRAIVAERREQLEPEAARILFSD